MPSGFSGGARQSAPIGPSVGPNLAPGIDPRRFDRFDRFGRYPEPDFGLPPPQAPQEHTHSSFGQNRRFQPLPPPVEPPIDIPLPDRSLQSQQRISTAAELIRSAQGRLPGTDSTLVTLTKMYKDADRYSASTNESFLDKFNTFMDLTQRAGVTPDRLGAAFPIMLKSRALDYYRQTCTHISDIQRLADDFERHFENDEYRDQKTAEWNSITLASELQKASNAGRPRTDVFNDMVTHLRQIQHAIPLELRTEDSLRRRILAAFKGTPGYRSIAAMGIQSTHRLVNAIVTHIADDPKATNESFYTDRNFNYSDRGKAHKLSRVPMRGNGKGPFRRPRRSDQRRPKDCWICGKSGCWSTKHAKPERDAFFEKLTNQKQPQRVIAFLMDQGPPDDSSETTLVEQIDEEIAEYYFLAAEDSADDSNDDDDSAQAQVFYTATAGSIPAEFAQEWLQILADSTTRHAITRSVDEDPHTTAIIRPIDTGPDVTTAAYISAAVPHHWDEHVFRGILIDTGAHGPSTVGLPQAKAYIRENGGSIDIIHGDVKAIFGISTTTSVGSLVVDIPIGTTTFYVVNTKPPTPFLLTIDDIDQAGIYYNNITDTLH
jgi:hypothetical protein